MNLHTVAHPPTVASEKPPVLVLLHGLAADEHDLLGLAGEIDPRMWVVTFRAPYVTGYGGYSWFGIQFLADGSRLVDEKQAESSVEILASELQTLPGRLEVEPSELILGGFSQGAMMASGVLWARPDLLDAVWLMSGTYMPVLDRGASEVHLPVLAQHGTHDEVLPIEGGRILALKLSEQGHEVRFQDYPMAHQISAQSLTDADAWLKDVLER